MINEVREGVQNLLPNSESARSRYESRGGRKVQTNLTIRADLSVGAANKLGILKDVVGWWKEHKGL